MLDSQRFLGPDKTAIAQSKKRPYGLVWAVFFGLKRVLIPLCYLGLALQVESPCLGQQAPATKPMLHFPLFNLLPQDAAGASISSLETRASMQQGLSFYSFETTNPTGPDLKVMVPPSGLKGRVQGQVLDGCLFFSQGREIRQGEGTSAFTWFQSERSFQEFQVFDQNQVALVWTWPQEMGANLIRTPIDTETLRQKKISLLELWDVPSMTCLELVPVPEGILALLDQFESFPLMDVRTYRGGDHLLIYFPLLAQIYDYDTGRKSLQQLKVPWDMVDPVWVRNRLRGERSPSFSILNLFHINDLKASPVDGGGLRFAYNSLPFRSDALASMGPAIPKGSLALFPRPPTPRGDTPAELQFHMAEWRPGENEIKPMQNRGAVLLEDKAELRRQGLEQRFQREGIFVSWGGVPQPMDDFVKELRSAHEERSKARVLSNLPHVDLKQQIVNDFYSLVIGLKSRGIPSLETIKKLSPLISSKLRLLLLRSQAAEARYAREPRDPRPPLVEGSLYFSFLEGAHRIVSVLADKKSSGTAYLVALEFGDPKDANHFSKWEDRALLAMEEGRWVVDDLEFLGKGLSDSKGKLSTVLEAIAKH